MDPKKTSPKQYDDITDIESDDNILEPLEDHFLGIPHQENEEEVTTHDDSRDDFEPTDIKKIPKD